MSLSLSNSLSFALIPLVKIGKNSKKLYWFSDKYYTGRTGCGPNANMNELKSWMVDELESESDIFPQK